MCPKRAFSVQRKEGEHYNWVLHIWIGAKFNLKWTILIAWTKFAQKEYFQLKTETENSAIEFCMFKLVKVPNLSLYWQFWIFGPNLLKKGISSQEQKKWTSPLNSACSNYQGTKFQLRLKILFFWSKFVQKGYFWSKAEKVNPTMESSIFELVQRPNLAWNWQFWLFGPNLPKKGISSRKQKKRIPPFNSEHWD